MKKKKVYMDWAATTPVKEEVLEVMIPYFTKKWGNPSSLHDWGGRVKEDLDKIREKLVKMVEADRVVFTSSATESSNLVHKGLVESVKKEGEEVRIITSLIEHKAVLETCKHLGREDGVKVEYLGVDREGKISVEDLLGKIRKETVLVSLIWVNNEVGSVQEIEEIGKKLKKVNEERRKKGWERVWFHADVTQGIGYLDFSLKKMGLDMASMTGHKIGAPKGIGALFLGKEVRLVRQMDGGKQELGLRGGTENVAFIVGLCKAIEMSWEGKKERREKVEKIKNYFWEKLLKIDGVVMNGSREKGAPHILSCRVEGAEGEALLFLMNDEGVGVSTGSACASQSLKPSYVLLALGVKQEDAHGSIRFSFSEETKKEEVDYVVEVFLRAIEKLRGIGKGVEF